MSNLIPGIDVSAWQPRIDWKAVAESGQRFVFIKATEGASYRSPTMKAQVAGALEAGLLVGYYHFARWERDDPEAQAEHFVRTVRQFGPGVLPPVLDLEWCSTGKKDPKTGKTIYHKRPAVEIAGWARRFVERVEALTGRGVIIYTGRSFWTSYLPKSGPDVSELSRRLLWTVDYSPKSEAAALKMTPKVPVDGWQWDFVQWTGSGQVPGVTRPDGSLAPCDRNFFRGTERELRLLALIEEA